MPIPDRRATISLMKAGTPNEQRIWSEHLTGASMTAEQLKHFTEVSRCPLCQQADSVCHRVLNCEATKELRKDFSEHITILQEYHNCHVDFPLVYMSDLHDFHEWYYRQVKIAVPEGVTLADVSQC
jgi:hypothetical protein